MLEEKGMHYKRKKKNEWPKDEPFLDYSYSHIIFPGGDYSLRLKTKVKLQ